MIEALHNPSLAYGILRVVIGVLLIMHGFPKIKNFSGVSAWFESIGMKPGKLWVLAAIGIEFFGGIFLVLGIGVPLLGLLLAVEMLVAMWKVKWGKIGLLDPGGWEIELLYCAAGVVLALGSAGSFLL